MSLMLGHWLLPVITCVIVSQRNIRDPTYLFQAIEMQHIIDLDTATPRRRFVE